MDGPDEGQGTYEERRNGTARCGTVSLRSFDEGIILTLGGKIENAPDGTQKYQLTGIPPTTPNNRLTNVCPPAGYVGVPITFVLSDDLMDDYVIPMLTVRRESISPALQRWHPDKLQYRTAAPGARYLSIDVNGTTVSGWDSYEEFPQADPYDINYEIKLLARNRGGVRQKLPRNQAESILRYVMKIFRPYSEMVVVDSINDVRVYDCFMESISSEDEIGDVTDRTIAFSLSVRVEAELDLDDPTEYPAATSRIIDGGLL